MELLRWVGLGVFFVTSLVIGIRLVLRARRAGEIPELLLGVTLLGMAPLGYGFSMCAHLIEPHFAMVAASLRGSGSLGVCVGATAHYLFVFQLFHHASLRTKGLVGLAIGCLFVAYAGDILSRGLINRGAPGAWYWLGMGLRMTSLGWGSLESIRYWRQLQRRVGLGLADPVVANRFLLWGTASGATVAAMAVSVVHRLCLAASILDGAGGMLLQTTLGLIATGAMGLADRPHPAYLRWLQRRAVAEALPSQPD